MTRETGLRRAKSESPKSASNTGAVMRCCESMLTASSSVTASLRFARRPARKSSNRARSPGPAVARISRMRVTWADAMSATSADQSSQYARSPTFSTTRVYTASRHCSTENRASCRAASASVSSPPATSPRWSTRSVSCSASRPSRATEFTTALKRSSCARRALSTCHTTRNRRLSFRASAGDVPAGTPTGRMM